MVAARGITSVLSFALDEAQLRKATLCVLYVKEISVFYGGGGPLGRTKWQNDPAAAAINLASASASPLGARHDAPELSEQPRDEAGRFLHH